MSGITDLSSQATTLLEQSKTQLQTLVVSDPSLQSVINSITNAVSTITTQAQSASSSIESLFTGVEAQVTLGYVRILHACCDGQAENLTQDFLADLGDLYDGVGLQKGMVDPAQDLYDFVMAGSTGSGWSSQVQAKVNTVVSSSTSTIGDLSDAASGAITIVSIGETVAIHTGLMGSVMATYPNGSKEDTWTDNAQKLIATDSLRTLAMNIALATPAQQGDQAQCQFVTQSGLLSQAISTQNSMNQKTDNLRSM